MCVHVCRGQRSVLKHCLLCFSWHGLLLAWSVPRWLASEAQDLACRHLLWAGITNTGYHTWLFDVDSGDWVSYSHGILTWQILTFATEFPSQALCSLLSWTRRLNKCLFRIENILHSCIPWEIDFLKAWNSAWPLDCSAFWISHPFFTFACLVDAALTPQFSLGWMACLSSVQFHVLREMTGGSDEIIAFYCWCNKSPQFNF